jgi:transcriptional regulator with XRE-family HTH domain
MGCKQENRLHDLRVDHGIKPEVLAVELGVNPATIYRWERGTIPAAYLVRLADRFDVSIDHLVGRDRIPAGASGEVR